MNGRTATMDGIERELQRFVSEEVLPDGGAVGLDEPLLESGRIDSIGLLQLLGHVEKTFGIDLLRVGGPRDFRTLAALSGAIRREADEEVRA